MRIEIVSTEIESRTVRSKKDGKEYTFYTQEGFYHDPSSRYPVVCRIPVDGPSAAHSPGMYRLASDALFVDRFGNLAIRRRFALDLDE